MRPFLDQNEYLLGIMIIVNMSMIMMNMIIIMVNMSTIMVNMSMIMVNMSTIIVNMSTIMVNMSMIMVNMRMVDGGAANSCNTSNDEEDRRGVSTFPSCPICGGHKTLNL